MEAHRPVIGADVAADVPPTIGVCAGRAHEELAVAVRIREL